MQIQSCIDHYTMWYNSRENFRKHKLTWLHMYGSLYVEFLPFKLDAPPQKKSKGSTLVVSIFQACILDLFNSREELTVS